VSCFYVEEMWRSGIAEEFDNSTADDRALRFAGFFREALERGVDVRGQLDLEPLPALWFVLVRIYAYSCIFELVNRGSPVRIRQGALSMPLTCGFVVERVGDLTAFNRNSP
jgi:hypothetical protein